MTLEVSTIWLIVASVLSFIWWFLIFSVAFSKIRNQEKWNSWKEPSWSITWRNIVISLISKVIQANVLIYVMVYASNFYEWSKNITLYRWIEASLRLWLWFCVVSYLNDILRDDNPKWKILWINMLWSLVMILIAAISYILLQNT